MKKVNSNGYALEFRKGEKWNETSKSWYMECKVCSEMIRVGNEDVLSTTCSSCVSRGLKEFEENDRS